MSRIRGLRFFQTIDFNRNYSCKLAINFTFQNQLKVNLCVGKKAIYPLTPDAQFKFVFFDILMAKKCNFKNRHWNQNSPLFSVESKKTG